MYKVTSYIDSAILLKIYIIYDNSDLSIFKKCVDKKQ